VEFSTNSGLRFVVGLVLDELQRPTRDAELVEGAELPPRLVAVVAAGNDARVAIQQLVDLFGFLAEKIDAEPSDAEFAHASNVCRCGLRNRVVHGVATTCIDMNWEEDSGSVAQFNAVSFAWPSAIRVIRPIR